MRTNRILVVRDLVRGRELVRDPECLQMLLELGADDIAQRHHDRTDLGADDLEATGDGADLLSDRRVAEALGEIAVLGETGEHRHEVRLAGAVVADDQQTFVVLWRVVPEMRQHDVADLLRHPVRDDVRLDQAARLLGGICLTKLDDRFDRIELKELSVLHRWFPSAMRWSADGPAWTMIAGTSV